MTSTGFPQRGFGTLLLAALTVCAPWVAVPHARQSPGAPAAPIDPGPIFRVFLANGTALASYGESAVVGDRVIFTLVVGDGGLKTQYQLISLPASSVDLQRTTWYRDAARAARYAATRGEADFIAVTSEVSRSLEQLMKMEDRQARLAAAEEAKRRLLTWSKENYNYRAKDIQTLAAQFDEVIAELRVAAGETRVSMDLVAGVPEQTREPVRRQPTLRESIEQALSAASAADVLTDRYAVLRAAAAASGDGGAAVGDLSAEVTRRLEEEEAWDREYAAFRADTLSRGQAAFTRGDVAAIDSVRSNLGVRAQPFGPARRDELQELIREIDELREKTIAHRAALDRYAAARPQLLAYERELRPLLSMLDSASPVLKSIEAMNVPVFAKVERTANTLGRLAPRLTALTPPDDLVDVHATFVSALHLAREACKRQGLALAANNKNLAREASASAAGATLLVEQARQILIQRLYPPKVR